MLGCQQALALLKHASEGVDERRGRAGAAGRRLAGVVVSDIRLPGMEQPDPAEKQLAARDRKLPVILITGHGDISMAVDAIPGKAPMTYRKTLLAERLVEICRTRVGTAPLTREVRRLLRAASWPAARRWKTPLIGHSRAIRTLRTLIPNWADAAAMC